MLDALIVPRSRDIGDGFMVRRALPAAERRTVGPFVFFDQMGPVTFNPTQGLAVRPHPHIGLATVTYLFEGEIMHRDSLGSVQAIRGRRLPRAACRRDVALRAVSGALAEGAIEFEGKAFGAGQLLVFRPGQDWVLAAPGRGARVLLLGGEPLGRRYLWWNFMASRRERLEQAAADWKAGRFAPVPGETEFIPWPERGPGGDVHYP